MVDISTHLSLFNILISKGGVKDGYQKYISYDFGHHHVYNVQNASFMHMLSPINGMKDVYVSLLKSRWQPRWQIQASFMEMPYFVHICIIFAFLKTQTFICQKNS